MTPVVGLRVTPGRQRAAGDGPGAGQSPTAASSCRSPPTVLPGTGALGGQHGGHGRLRRCPAAASTVLTACATATGATLSAALKVTASMRSGSSTRSVMRAVSPGASATVTFSMSGFSMIRVGELVGGDEPRIRDVREQHGLRLLQQRAAEHRRRLIHLVRDQLALEARGKRAIERQASP